MFGALGILFFFFFNDTATTEIYTLSLHDALPICATVQPASTVAVISAQACSSTRSSRVVDRKSTRLNSSHSQISYAVFCLKKKKLLLLNRSHPARPQDRTGHQCEAEVRVTDNTSP